MPWDLWDAGLLDCRIVGLQDRRTVGLQDCGIVGLWHCGIAGPQDYGTAELWDCEIAGLQGLRGHQYVRLRFFLLLCCFFLYLLGFTRVIFKII